MDAGLAAAASLIGEPARAAMLLKLMTGRASSAGELAFAANISPQTASGHLAKLIEGRFVSVDRQGRHRYYRLAGTEVADAVEALLVLTPEAREAAKRQANKPQIGTLAHARTCYAHLAGWLGVRIADALQAKAFLLPAPGKTFAVTDAGRAWFNSLGIPLSNADPAASHKVARQCLDWTERRPHLAGPLGAALYKRFVELRWIAPIRNTRAVRVTVEGKREFWKRLQIPLT